MKVFKRMVARLLAALMIISLLPVAAVASDAADIAGSGTCGDNLTWTLDAEGTLTISGEGIIEDYSGYYWNYNDIKNVVIEYGVTGIGHYAFSENETIKSISIPNSVKTISSQAFEDCNALEEIVLPDSLTSVDDYVFWQCKSLKSVYISSSVTKIGTGAFFGCYSLSSINVSEENSVYASIDGVLFNKDKTELISCPKGKSGEYIIPEGTLKIGYDSFSHCKYISNVIIPDSVTDIDMFAFEYCENLEVVDISNSISSIGNMAFRGCSSLTALNVDRSNATYSSLDGVLFNKVGTILLQYPCGKSGVYDIPNGVITINDDAFYTCKNLTSVTIPESVTDISPDSFASCNSLESLTIPGNVVSIGHNSFRDCEALESVVICDGVETIGDNAFANCSRLKNLTIGDSVITIENGVFENCRSLASVVLPEGLDTLNDMLFYNCSSLTSVYFGANVSTIGSDVFENCNSLEEIQISSDNSNYYFKDDILYKKSSNEVTLCLNRKAGEVTIPEGIKIIGESAFKNCYNITYVVIPNGVTEIDWYAFDYCRSLSSIVIPLSVNKIGFSAFGYDIPLTDIYYGGTEEDWNKISIEVSNYCLEDATIHFAEVPVVCNHTWMETAVVVPTCVEDGYIEQVCTICGETHTETIPALGHTLGERKITVSPTCTDEGIASVSCETCGTILEEEVLPATGHTVEYVQVYAPTCSSTGRGEDRCTVCGVTVKSYTIPRRAHNINRVETAPTCTEDGTYENWCVNCGFLIAHGPIDALGHDFVYVETTSATCTENGSRYRECTRCGMISDEEVIPALGHTLGEKKITVYPKCTVDGKATVSCTVCGEIISDEVIPALGHNIFVAEDKKATCTESGHYMEGCSRCGYKVHESFEPALGHDYISETVDPEPDAPGYTVYTCTRCGDSYISDPTEYEGDFIIATVGTVDAKIGDTVSVDITVSDAPELKMLSIADLVYDETKLELISGKWIVNAVISDWDADTNTGVAVFSKNTDVNGAVFTFTFNIKEDIDECTIPVKCTFSARTKPADGVETNVAVKNIAGEINAVICLHEWITSVTDATCTEDGETKTYCTLCGTILAEEVIAATGHNMESTSVDPTCTSDGYTRKVCSACGYEEIFDIIPALGHNFSLHTVEPTCIQDGYSYNCCDRCGVETDRTVIEALGHAEFIAEYVQETCFENGYVKYVCIRCMSALREEEIPAAHKYQTTVYQATPYAPEGYTLYTCTACGDTYKGDYNTYVENGEPKAVLGCVTGRSGETVTISLDFMNMPGVKALGISDLIYDRNRLELIDGAWNTDAILYAWDMVKETGVAAFTEKTQLDGTVFTFTFKILEDAEDCEIPVYCTIDVRTVDDEGNEVVCDIDTYGGRITVNNVLRGDVNGDGTVNSDDAIFLLRHIGMPEYYTINQNGDMNGDGYVDSDDAIYLLYHVMFSDSEDWKLYE